MLCCRWRRSISAITEPTAAWPWTFTARTNTPLNCVRLALPALFSKRNSRPLPVCDFILMPQDLKWRRGRLKRNYIFPPPPKRKRHKKNQFRYLFSSSFSIGRCLFVPPKKWYFWSMSLMSNVRPFFIFIATTITFNFIGPVDNGGLPIEAFAVQYKLAGQVWDEKPLQRVWPVGGNQYYDLHDSISHASTGLFVFFYSAIFYFSFLFFFISIFIIDFFIYYFPPFFASSPVVCSELLRKKRSSEWFFYFYSSHFQLSPHQSVCNLVSISYSLLPVTSISAVAGD